MYYLNINPIVILKMAPAYVPPHLRHSAISKKSNHKINIHEFPALGDSTIPKQDKTSKQFDFKAAANQVLPEEHVEEPEILPGWVKLSKNHSPIENKIIVSKKPEYPIEYISEKEKTHYEIAEKFQVMVNRWEAQKHEEFERNGYLEFDIQADFQKDDYESDTSSESSDDEQDYVDEDGEPYNDFDLLDKRFMTK